MDFHSITWRIENFSMCLHGNGKRLISPPFTLHELESSSFEIFLYPNGCEEVEGNYGNYVSCFVKRYDVDKTSNINSFVALFSIVNTNLNSSVKKFYVSMQLGLNEVRGFAELVSRDDLYRDSDNFLPNDVLTFQLRICPTNQNRKIPPAKKLEEMFLSNPLNLNFAVQEYLVKDSGTMDLRPIHTAFVTHVPVEKRILVWDINKLSEKINSEARIPVALESQVYDGVSFTLICYFDKNEDDSSLMLEISRTGTDLQNIVVKCDVFFMDSSNAAVCMQNFEELFDETYQRCPLLLIESCNSSQEYINNDTLKMKLEFMILHEPRNVEPVDLSDDSSRRDTMMTTIQDMLEKEEAIDVTFESRSKKRFPAHKLLICAKSPKFRELLSKSDTEQQTEVVIQMPSTDTETVKHLRDYLYYEELPDLGTEEILNLFFAAEEYDIQNLKEDCVTFLKRNLSLVNVYDVLKAADANKSSELKEYVVDFLIADMDFDSEEWEVFTSLNIELAIETMKKCLVKKRKYLN